MHNKTIHQPKPKEKAYALSPNNTYRELIMNATTHSLGDGTKSLTSGKEKDKMIGVMDVKINEMIPEVLNKLAGAKLEQNAETKKFVTRRMVPRVGRKNWESSKKISAFTFPQNSDIPEEVLREQRRLGERQGSILEKQASRGTKPSSQESMVEEKFGERRRQSEDPATIYSRAKKQIMDSYDHGMFSPSGLSAE